MKACFSNKKLHEILSEILELAKKELKDKDSVGYTMPDGKHHLFILTVRPLILRLTGMLRHMRLNPASFSSPRLPAGFPKSARWTMEPPQPMRTLIYSSSPAWSVLKNTLSEEGQCVFNNKSK